MFYQPGNEIRIVLTRRDCIVWLAEEVVEKLACNDWRMIQRERLRDWRMRNVMR